MSGPQRGRPLALAAALTLAGCGSTAADGADGVPVTVRAERVARIICQGAPGDLALGALEACIEDNRAMFLEYQEEELP